MKNQKAILSSIKSSELLQSMKPIMYIGGYITFIYKKFNSGTLKSISIISACVKKTAEQHMKLSKKHLYMGILCQNKKRPI